jgi:hypothetical protein
MSFTSAATQDGDKSLLLFNAPEMPDTLNCTKRILQIHQILGRAWVFHEIITTNIDQLHFAKMDLENAGGLFQQLSPCLYIT